MGTHMSPCTPCSCGGRLCWRPGEECRVSGLETRSRCCSAQNPHGHQDGGWQCQAGGTPPHPPCRPHPQQVNSAQQVPDTAASSPCRCAQHTLPIWGQVTTATEHSQPHCPSSVPWGCNPLWPRPPHPSTGKLHKAGLHPPCSECVPGDRASAAAPSPAPLQLGVGLPPCPPPVYAPSPPMLPPYLLQRLQLRAGGHGRAGVTAAGRCCEWHRLHRGSERDRSTLA